MNKGVGLVFVILILFVSLVFVSAQSPVFENIADGTKDIISKSVEVGGEVVGPLFGDREVLTKIFFAVLVFMILYSIVSVIFAGRWFLTVGISSIITILSVFFLPANFVEAIRVHYGALGAAILSIIPFLIMLVFSLRVQSALVSRVIWIFYAVYYFALYLYLVATSGEGFISAESIPYLFAIIAGIAIFFVIGPIRKAIFYGELESMKESGSKVALRSAILHKLQTEELEQAYGDEAGIK